MSYVEIDESGKRVLLMGNEAIARGAIEAGVNFCSSYPGTPASEIMETLIRTADKFGHYAEWSVNEKVALEAAGAAAYSGLRALTAMKCAGVNVCADFLVTTNLAGTRGGFILVSSDDPSAHSSTAELDTRHYARYAEIPLLEPATTQEAKDMTKWAFDLSEELMVICMIRSTTRLSHSRGVVTLGPIPREKRTADFTPTDIYMSVPATMRHFGLHQTLKRAQTKFEESEFNWHACISSMFALSSISKRKHLFSEPIPCSAEMVPPRFFPTL